MKFRRTPPRSLSEGTVMLAMAGAAVLAAARLYPFDRFPLVACPWRTIAHVPCPTCGMTRAFMRIAHGEFGAAIQVSPLGGILALATIAFVVYVALRLTLLKRGFELEVTAREARMLRLGGTGAVLANWVYLIASGSAA